MNNDKNTPVNPSTSVGAILGSMIDQLNTSNLNLASQVQQISSATTGTLGRIVDTVTNPQPRSQSSSSASPLLSALNPLAARGGSNILSSLLLGPLWRGVFSLFGGGSSEPALPPLTRFDFPEPTRTEVAAQTTPSAAPSPVRRDSLGLAQPAAPPVNITIQALDGRSILDRSDDIAAALRKAMMSNHEINDNLGEL